MIKWWGYEHTNGTIHIKRYFSEEDLIEAEDSPFVKDVRGPVEAPTKEKALEIMFKKGE